MALNNFFTINFPYGLKKTVNNEWYAFNREYMPLGWNTTDGKQTIHSETAYNELPIRTEYKGLTEKAILKILTNPDRIQRDENGQIVTVLFYDDETPPRDYFKIIKAFSKFNVLDNE
jgi:hypothetical protein